jgi:chromosomal replication initiator protein
MNQQQYASRLEKKLIDKFKEDFFNKFEYYPVVLTKINLITDESDRTALISLDELESYFTPFLPIRYDKVVHLKQKLRIREITELRSIFCFLARNMSYSLKTIGEYLNGRDHTTVIHSVNTFKDLIETCPVFREKYHRVLDNIKQINNITDESPIMECLQKIQY